MRRATAFAVTALALTALAACGGDDDEEGAATTMPAGAAATTPGPDTTAAAATTAAPASSAATAATAAAGGAELVIADFAFPADLTVAAGAPISVVNQDDAGHTVTGADDAFDVAVAAGATAELVIDEPGTYQYACSIHPNMMATIIVE